MGGNRRHGFARGPDKHPPQLSPSPPRSDPIPSPNSRDEYKQNLLLNIYQLVQATLTDDNSNSPPL